MFLFDVNSIHEMCIFQYGMVFWYSEYHSIMSLVADALNTLEANRYTFGIYLPTLLGLQYQLQQLITQLSRQSSEEYIINVTNAEGESRTVASNCLPLAVGICHQTWLR